MRFFYSASASLRFGCALPTLATTKGLNRIVTPQLQFNPALYVSSATGHKLWSYADTPPKP